MFFLKIRVKQKDLLSINKLWSFMMTSFIILVPHAGECDQKASFIKYLPPCFSLKVSQSILGSLLGCWDNHCDVGKPR